MRKERESVTRGSGNVYADLGMSHPDERLLKAKIVSEIQRLINQKQLPLADTADLLDLDIDQLSEMLHGHFMEFSIDRLIKFVTALGSDVQIVILDRNGREGEPSLSVVTV